MGDGNSDLIALDDGWSHCWEKGISPLLSRIETAFDDNEFERCTIKATTYMEVYDKVFKMCIQRDPDNHSEALYDRLSQAISDYLQNTVAPELTKARGANEILFLREWTKRWKYQKILVRGLAGMFTYIDRFFVPNSEDKLTLSEQGYSLFRSEIYDKFQTAAKDAILNAVFKEREGEQQDADLLQTSVLVYVELGCKVSNIEVQLYQDDLETPIVELTKQYYIARGRAWMDEDTCPEYLIKVETALRNESQRVDSYLYGIIKPKLIAAVRRELLQMHQIELMEKPSGINAMLEADSVADLSRLYRLFKEVDDGIKDIAKAFRDHVKRIGVSYIDQSKEESAQEKGDQQSMKDEHDLIKKLITLHEQYLAIVQGCFQSDTLIEKGLREAFEDCINREYYTSNLLAKFVNALLTKGSKVSVAALEQTLDHVVMLYGYIRDKDIFEEEYQMYLSNRLLTSKSESHQAEKTMIAKLKSECGYHWTSKLESMFKDVQLSEELMQQFMTQFSKQFNMELKVNICTMGRWPSAVLPTCTMPTQIRSLTDTFKLFYLNKHSGKKIEYQMDKGEADVSVRFGEGPKASPRLLVVSTFQMVVLLLYNDRLEHTFQQIAEATTIPPSDLEVHLLSLAHPKVRILNKHPNTREVKPDHLFSLNSAYASKLFRVKVPLMKAPAKKSIGVDPKIQIQRRHQIDAGIVRIMKTRQRLHHNALIAEVIKQLQRFKPAAGDIKKRIEYLIEQEYLERDDSDRRLYNYLA